MGLGTNLKKLLKDKGMTIKELSEISGVSVNTLYSITKRDSLMSRYDIIKKIAYALEVSTETLTGQKIDESQTTLKNARLYEVIKKEEEAPRSIDIKKLNEALNISDDPKFNPELMNIITDIANENLKKEELNKMFDDLNETGQDKAVEQVEMLTKIPEYQRKTE